MAVLIGRFCPSLACGPWIVIVLELRGPILLTISINKNTISSTVNHVFNLMKNGGLGEVNLALLGVNNGVDFYLNHHPRRR